TAAPAQGHHLDGAEHGEQVELDALAGEHGEHGEPTTTSTPWPASTSRKSTAREARPEASRWSPASVEATAALPGHGPPRRHRPAPRRPRHRAPPPRCHPPPPGGDGAQLHHGEEEHVEEGEEPVRPPPRERGEPRRRGFRRRPRRAPRRPGGRWRAR